MRIYLTHTWISNESHAIGRFFDYCGFKLNMHLYCRLNFDINSSNESQHYQNLTVNSLVWCHTEDLVNLTFQVMIKRHQS